MLFGFVCLFAFVLMLCCASLFMFASVCLFLRCFICLCLLLFACFNLFCVCCSLFAIVSGWFNVFFVGPCSCVLFVCCIFPGCLKVFLFVLMCLFGVACCWFNWWGMVVFAFVCVC